MKHKDGLEFYKKGKQFRWRVRRKGRIIASATEGYSTLAKAVKNFRSIADYFYCELDTIFEFNTLSYKNKKFVWNSK